MKREIIAEKGINILVDTLGQPDLGEKARTGGDNRFTRKRKLTCRRLILLIISGIRLALQLAADDLFKALGHTEDTVSKQAVSKARGFLSPDFVKGMFTEFASVGSDCDDMELFKGKYRLVALDGSCAALDNADAIKAYFGCSGSKKDAATGLISMAYDPLNDWILDASLNPYKTNERMAAKGNIAAVEALPGNHKNLYIQDRGYNSRRHFAWMIDNNLKFLVRVREKFDLDFDNTLGKGEWVSFGWEGKTYQVRVIKVLLSSGITETLVTNLCEKTLPAEDAGPLYFKRWRIEVKFNILKEKLQLENMSGRRPITVFQDLWAPLHS